MRSSKNILAIPNINDQPSYSYVNKKFHCFGCNKEFKKMVRSDEGATCDSCNSEFVEEVTRESSNEISHFTPYVMREQPREQPREHLREQPQMQTIRIVRAPQYSYVTQTITPEGLVITRRVIGDSSGNPFMNQRPQPQGFFESLFGLPFGGIRGGVRPFTLDDIIELSMRDAGNQGVPPASDEAISKLPEIDVKEGEHQCSICMDDIKEKGIKLPCGHMYDKNCITTWLKQHDTCPVCRKSTEERASS